MDNRNNCDLAVIGGGPAGMMCAITAAERGLREERRLFRFQDPNDDFHDIVVGPEGGIVAKEDL